VTLELQNTLLNMTKEDLIKYQAFKKVLNEGDFTVKGQAILAVASLFHWYNNLETEIKKAIEPPKACSHKPIKGK
jgi:hypothetical protein